MIDTQHVKRIVIKLGTSTLTRDDGPPDGEFIDQIAADVADQTRGGRSVVLVSSGAIRAGMFGLALEGRPRTIPQKQAAAAVGQRILMDTYARSFAKQGLNVGQVLLTREDFRQRSRYMNVKNTFQALLKYGAIPIVNENDTVSTDEIKFGDNDTLAALVASLIEANLLLLLSDVAGLYDRNPTEFSDANLISRVDKIDRRIEQLAGEPSTDMGTGGMITKIRAAKICVSAGIDTIIADGRHANVIAESICGTSGTRFVAGARTLRQRQQWVVHGGAVKGSVTVDDGAKERILNGGKSLLAAGILSVQGEFGSGDLVRVADRGGTKFAKGLTNYASTEIERILGKKSLEIASLLGKKCPDEVIHRNNLVLD